MPSRAQQGLSGVSTVGRCTSAYQLDREPWFPRSDRGLRPLEEYQGPALNLDEVPDVKVLANVTLMQSFENNLSLMDFTIHDPETFQLLTKSANSCLSRIDLKSGSQMKTLFLLQQTKVNPPVLDLPPDGVGHRPQVYGHVGGVCNQTAVGAEQRTGEVETLLKRRQRKAFGFINIHTCSPVLVSRGNSGRRCARRSLSDGFHSWFSDIQQNLGRKVRLRCKTKSCPSGNLIQIPFKLGPHKHIIEPNVAQFNVDPTFFHTWPAHAV
jgi:hypothetical protein